MYKEHLELSSQNTITNWNYLPYDILSMLKWLKNRYPFLPRSLRRLKNSVLLVTWHTGSELKSFDVLPYRIKSKTDQSLWKTNTSSSFYVVLGLTWFNVLALHILLLNVHVYSNIKNVTNEINIWILFNTFSADI